MSASGDRFRILVVCTGNICRSPMAEQLFRHRIRERLGAVADSFAVQSAGTYALVGEQMDPYAARMLADLGVGAAPFTARDLTAPMMDEADLVLGATRQHRAAAVTLQPRAARHSFTLREFARLVTAVDETESAPAATAAERARTLVEQAAAQRGYAPVQDPSADDVVDPYLGSIEEFRAAAAHICGAVDRIVDRLAGVVVRSAF